MHSVAEVESSESKGDLVACWQNRENLELLVADELADPDAHQRYPSLFVHLAECRDCRAIYLLLRDTLLAEQRDRLTPIPTSPPVPSFGESPDERVPWRRQCGRSPHPFPLIFNIAYEFLSKALRGPQLAFVRGEIAEDGERDILLLADAVPTEQGDLIAEVTIHHRIDQVGSIDLEIQLVSDWTLPDGLGANLSWADVQRSEPVTDDGKVYFHDFALSNLIEQKSDEVEADLTLAFVCN